jgi:predicted CXXCH cytochrome family protein
MNAATRVPLLAALVCLALMASPVWARARAGSGLAGSPHDFTKQGNSVPPNERNADMCMFCHAKLTTSTLIGNARNRTSGSQALDVFDSPPLWNHELSANYKSYTMYQNGSGAPQAGAKASQASASGRTPGSTSLICLSCHDGSAALNSYGNNSQLTRFAVIGKDNYLGNHHPVGFDYDAVRSVDKEIRSADAAHLTATTTVRDHLYGDENTKMECGTCHSVHNTGNAGETLLWRSDVRSSLCLTCHDKGMYTPPPFSAAPPDEGDLRADLGRESP